MGRKSFKSALSNNKSLNLWSFYSQESKKISKTYGNHESADEIPGKHGSCGRPEVAKYTVWLKIKPEIPRPSYINIRSNDDMYLK